MVGAGCGDDAAGQPDAGPDAGVLDAGKDPAKAIAVFRVPGAWEEEGFKILKKYGVPYVDRTVSIDQAAKFAVERTQGLG